MSHMCDTWLIHLCGVHICALLADLAPVSISKPWFIHICDNSHICDTWLIYAWREYLHPPYRCSTYIHMRAMIHSSVTFLTCVAHGSFTYAAYMFAPSLPIDYLHSYACHDSCVFEHDSCMRVPINNAFSLPIKHLYSCAQNDSFIHDMTYSCVWPYTLRPPWRSRTPPPWACAKWLIHTRDIKHSRV